jgi:hypothetical protein
MMLNALRWLITPGCGIAALLLVYDTRRALQPRIAGERPWRETRVIGLVTVVVGALALQRFNGTTGWVNGAIQTLLVLALVPLLWSSVSLTRLVSGVRRQGIED